MLFVFDWDGTLSDSTDKIADCLALAIDELGLAPRSLQERKNIIGLGLSEAILALYPDLTESRIYELRDAYSKHYLLADAAASPLYPEAEETLIALKNSGHKVAVATGKSRRGLDRVLSRLGMADCFHATRCADEACSKPDPLMLHQLMQQLQVSAGQTIMIGDTEYDLEMAARAGVRSVGVDFGAHEVARLQKHNPIMVISTLSQVLSLR